MNDKYAILHSTAGNVVHPFKKSAVPHLAQITIKDQHGTHNYLSCRYEDAERIQTALDLLDLLDASPDLIEDLKHYREGR